MPRPPGFTSAPTARRPALAPIPGARENRLVMAAREDATAEAPDAGEPQVVVSGLPRSGTSLVMQMLAAGGLAPMTDGVRVPDPDNPRGYLEWEPVKRLRKHPERLAEARGRAVKVVSPLLPALPPGRRYRVLWVERDLAEVEASQRAMLERSRPGAADEEPDLLPAWRRHLEQLDRWLAGRPDVEVLRLRHDALLERPRAAARDVADFLGLPLDPEAMAAAVDPGLYRQRRRGGRAGSGSAERG